MRLSTIMALLAAASAVIGASGVWSFYRSFDPIPTDLHSYTGIATNVRTATALYSRSHATFQLNQPNGETIEFSYEPAFKRFYYFAEHLRDGITLEVTTGPGGREDIWGIKLGSQTLMTPNEAREARMANGRWGLALFFGFLASATWSARQAKIFRQRGE